MLPSPQLPEPLFPNLAGRPGGIGPEQVARHQHRRLQGAMLEAVARHGYGAMTITELVTLAGVSKTTFYEHFEDKQECFLATFDEIVAQASKRVGVAYRSQTGFCKRLRAAMEAFAEIVAEEPAASALVVVDSLSLGAAGVRPRERALEAFELMFRQSFAQTPERGEVSELQVRAIVAGIRRVVYRCLREGRPEEFRDHVEELLEWALIYQRPDGGAPAEAVAAAPTPPRPRRTAEEDSGPRPPGWEEPPNSRRSRSDLTQRERIVRAVAQLATERGYGALSIPAISAAAGTSNQTFYEHFGSTQEAFLAAFEALMARSLGVGVEAFEAQEHWADGIAAGLAALLSHIAGDRLFARLGFFELAAAGPAGLERANRELEGFAVYLRPEGFGASTPKRPPECVVDAIVGGIWTVIQHEIFAGREAELPQLAPQIAAIALVPFGVV